MQTYTNSNPRSSTAFWFRVIAAVYCVYAALFILDTSFGINGTLWFSLFDDAMVSMRFARNLAQGHGLVWNPGGERVEGFTNPLWVGVMAALHLLPVAESKICLLVQLLCAGILLANLFAIRALAAEFLGRDNPWTLFAVFLTAFFYPLNYWTLQGMEVGALALLVAYATLLTLRRQAEGKGVLPVYLLLGVGTFLRLDAAIPFLVILFYGFCTPSPRRVGNGVSGLMLLVLFLGIQTAARHAYYQEWVPNTYTLKMTGFPALARVEHGMRMFYGFAARTNWLLVAAPILLLVFRADMRHVLLMLLFGAQCAYSIYVGGDSWEWNGMANRFITTVMPFYFVLLACTLAIVVPKLAEAVPPIIMEKSKWVPAVVLWGFLAAITANFNYRLGLSSIEEWLLQRRPLHVLDNKQHVELALAIREGTQRDATVAVVWAGSIPYFSDRVCLDQLGKCDKQIAAMKAKKTPAHMAQYKFYPGHNKWDFDYSIVAQKPDLVVETWPPMVPVMDRLVDSYTSITVAGMPVYWRNDSQKVDIAKLTFAGSGKL
ncbi:MAG: hypothetical protein K1X53_14520 [Candidatus Sumerlaeaceae bacterium]|nr:hypothetical protein [Candidatus Sumerlaeaceae bacterium]